MSWLGTLVPLLIVATYCVVRAVIDLRQRRWWWGLAGVVSAAAILTVPISTHAVKVDLPVSDAD